MQLAQYFSLHQEVLAAAAEVLHVGPGELQGGLFGGGEWLGGFKQPLYYSQEARIALLSERIVQ